MQNTIKIIPISYEETVQEGTKIEVLVKNLLREQNIQLLDKDILVITQKIVSKAEGQIIDLSTITPSPFAKDVAARHKKDSRQIEVILQESKRIVRMDHRVIISETNHGFICANAGVDASNIESAETVSLLPKAPDKTAEDIRQQLEKMHRVKLGVIISDTWGRPWREGQVNFAIGTSGFDVLIDYRGQKDPYGYLLQVSLIAVADELAGAAELVMGKTNRVPFAIIRGYNFTPSEKNAKALLREPTLDMFR